MKITRGDIRSNGNGNRSHTAPNRADRSSENRLEEERNPKDAPTSDDRTICTTSTTTTMPTQTHAEQTRQNREYVAQMERSMSEGYEAPDGW